MNYAERVAKRVLETVFQGTTLEYCSTQSHGEYDFDLHHGDGTVAAVEVTAAVDELLLETMGAIRNKRRGGATFDASICKKSWIIFPVNGAPINSIRARADEQLAKLEQEGIDRFFLVSGRTPSVQEVCCNLQITSGAAVSSEEDAFIHIASPIGGGAVGASIAIEAGEREAWKNDNRKKLVACRRVNVTSCVHV